LSATPGKSKSTIPAYSSEAGKLKCRQAKVFLLLVAHFNFALQYEVLCALARLLVDTVDLLLPVVFIFQRSWNKLSRLRG
jgi:hypothetical protein